MPQPKTQRSADIIREGNYWMLHSHEDDSEPGGYALRQWCNPMWIGPATGPYQLTRTQALLIASEKVQSQGAQDSTASGVTMTIADFVKRKFVPEHVATKNSSGRTHYQAILKHVITPEAVDQAFQVDAQSSRTKLKAVASWPYLNDLRLVDARPDDVQRLIAAALANGYSTQTATHIRSTVRAIFTHAQKERCFSGENPASQVWPPEIIRKEAHVLTLAQAKEVLAAMRYPDKEIAFLAILTSMHLSEIFGLQWKQVNLTEEWSNTDGEPIPPWTIARTKHWSTRRLDGARSANGVRNLPITEALRPVLLALSKRSQFTGPDDYLLIHHAGNPISTKHFASHRLKTIGKKLQLPWLTWQVFRRTHRTLAQEFGVQGIAHASFEIDSPSMAAKPKNGLTFSASG